MKELIGKSISDLRQLLDTKELKARELAEAHIEQARACESRLNAYNCICAELALAQADKVDELLSSGKIPSRLAGIPLALKDNICVANYPSTCSSKILANFIPPYQASVAELLEKAGAVFVGKTNMDEFAMGSSTENSAFKATKNPWDLERVPGGSSGGSACAVASGSAVVSLGSDTGGSIRQPASFCGLVGMKPTYGLVSRFGLIAFASSLDQIGPFGRTVEDAAELLQVIAAHDPRDSSSYKGKELDMFKDLRLPLKGMKIGLIQELIGQGIDNEVKEAVLKAAALFEELGAKVSEIAMPHLRHALPVYYLIATAEASANLARFDGVRYGLRSKSADDLLMMYEKTRQEGFGPEVKRRIMLGTYALSSGYYDAYYKKAQKVRSLIKRNFDKEFESFDLLISPTAPTPAFELGAKIDDPLSMYLSDIATIPANLAGIPALSLPCGFSKNNLPIGLQILGPALSDQRVLQAAYAFEQASEFHKSRPESFFSIQASHA